MKLAVTGTRHGLSFAHYVLDSWSLHFGAPELVILGGDDNDGVLSSRGVDRQSLDWALRHGVAHRVIYATWKDGDRAGPKRNGKMASVCGPGDHCIALPDRRSKGTWDCARQMFEHGTFVHIIPLTGPNSKPVLPWEVRS